MQALLIWICSFVAALAAAVPSVTFAQDASKLEAIFADYDRTGSPGVSVAVRHDGKEVLRKHFGMANLADDIAITDETVFNIGSVSKHFTVFAILLLEERGKLALSDDIRTHLPELAGMDRAITLEQLARHTSGLRSPNFLALMVDWRQPDMRTNDQMLRLLYRQRSLEFAPGERYKYTNAGTALLAEVVARISGQSFADFMTSQVFGPLGMTSTFVRDDITSIIPHEAHGYFSEQGTIKTALNPISHFGFSNVYSTASDMSLWAENFWTHKVGSQRIFDAMQSDTVLADGLIVEHAMGLFRTPVLGKVHYQHTGSHRAYLAYFGVFPESRSAIIMLSNDASFDLFGRARSVSRVIFGIEPADAANQTAPQTALQAARQAETASIDRSLLVSFAGFYWSERNKILREIRIKDDRIQYLRPDGRETLFDMSATGVGFAQEDASFQIEFTDEALVTRYDGEEDKLIRVEPVMRADTAEVAGVYFSHEIGSAIELVDCGTELLVSLAKREPLRAEPVFSDTFQTGQWFLSHLQFFRDSSGNVTGLYASNVNVTDVRFERMAPLHNASAAGSPPVAACAAAS